jgi:hypothetical protein
MIRRSLGGRYPQSHAELLLAGQSLDWGDQSGAVSGQQRRDEGNDTEYGGSNREGRDVKRRYLKE